MQVKRTWGEREREREREREVLGAYNSFFFTLAPDFFVLGFSSASSSLGYPKTADERVDEATSNSFFALSQDAWTTERPKF